MLRSKTIFMSKSLLGLKANNHFIYCRIFSYFANAYTLAIIRLVAIKYIGIRHC